LRSKKVLRNPWSVQYTAIQTGVDVVKYLFTRFVKDESGATAIEYGLIAAIVSSGIVVSLGTLKSALVTTFDATSTAMTGAN
jgi:pilus assembly protein Flp/PilA